MQSCYVILISCQFISIDVCIFLHFLPYFFLSFFLGLSNIFGGYNNKSSTVL